MATRRLLEVKGDLALYRYEDREMRRTWECWEPAPAQPDNLDQLRPLTEPGQAEVPLSLYGGDDRAHRDTERRRKVNALLEKRGLRPRGMW